jgi:fluoroquinolone resistance protein
LAGAVPSSGDLVQDQVLAEADWTDADLSEATFVGCAIERPQLSGVNLSGARFQRCRLPGWRLSHADLREASFEECTFSEPQTRSGLAAVFSNLEAARFRRCDLSLGLFDRSSLYDVEMLDCNLRGARFPKTDFSKSFGRSVVRASAVFRDCTLELADLSGAKLAGCALVRCDLREADFGGADLEGADLTGSNLFQAALTGARLAGADLRGAEVSGLDLAVLASREGMKITADQQFRLLTALGVDVSPD